MKPLISLLCLLLCLTPAFAADPVTCLLEAESAAPTPTPPKPEANAWSTRDLPDASAGRALFVLARNAPLPSPPLPFPLTPSAAASSPYRFWVRYYKKSATSGGLYALVRDDTGEEIAFSYLDQMPGRVPTETPYLKTQPRNGDTTGFIWESFDAKFERPLTAQLSFGSTGNGEQHLDCVILTTDLNFNPTTLDASALANLPAPSGKTAAPQPPPGFTYSGGSPANPDFFAGLPDPDQRFWAGLINNGSTFADAPRMIRMGFNRDHSERGVFPWGIRAMTTMEGFNDPAFTKDHPTPAGRFINSKGDVGQGFSIHYQPWIDAATEGLKKRMAEVLAGPNDYIGFWRISAEEGGWLDYSPYAQTAFRSWLKEKHSSIAKLNQRWATNYTTFDEIVPPPTFDEGRACWLDFREFSGHSYAESVGRRIPIIQALDPKHRPCLGANSNLDIACPYFMAFRPNDWEELIRVGLKDEKYVAFDIYCADDDMASSIDFLTSLSQGRKLINQEFSNHVVDPRIAARTYWAQVAKGVHGIHLFMMQEGPPGHATYPKWALLNSDREPKQKLAAYSDAVQEVHRLEPLLMSATYTHAVKPVAMYWSRIDLGLEKPHDSFYGHGLNAPIHIYRTLRSLGYPVRWITPRQIAEGELAQVGALVLAGANDIPQAAATEIEKWVTSGGTVLADGFPGGYDEYAQPQTTLVPLFGVRPAAPKAKKGVTGQIAIQESKQGYGEVTDAAVAREKYYEKIDEIAQQPHATHPVALALGDYMVAGYNLAPVECVAGHIVGMTHRGQPGFVVNDYGQGKAFYSAFLLGTIYEAAPVRYEWDTTHSGLSYSRVLDAFLKYAGVKPSAQITGLPPRIAAKVRVESPLITPDGNVLIGLTSMNDDVVKPFDLEIELPAAVTSKGAFTSVLVATNGSRELQPIPHQVAGSRLKLRMPAYDTHATILALRDTAPLVALDLKDVTRGPANVAVINPQHSFEIQATVHNPSPRELPAGLVKLTTPAGWLQSETETKIPAISAAGSATCTFRVRSPDLAAACRINPIVARFENQSIKSTPATEMVWWGLKAQ